MLLTTEQSEREVARLSAYGEVFGLAVTGDYGSHEMAGYADPGHQGDSKPRYPTKENGKLSPERIHAAWGYIHQRGNAGKYSAGQLAGIKSRIRSAAAEAGVQLHEDQVAASTVALAGPPWRAGSTTTWPSGRTTSSSRSPSRSSSSSSSSSPTGGSSPAGLGASPGGIGGHEMHDHWPRGAQHYRHRHVQHDADHDAQQDARQALRRGATVVRRTVQRVRLTAEEQTMTSDMFGSTPLRLLGPDTVAGLEASGQVPAGTAARIWPAAPADTVALSAGEPAFDGMSLDELDAAEAMFGGDWDVPQLAQLTGVSEHAITEKIELTAGYGSGFVVEGRERAVLLAAVAKDLLNLAGNGRDGTEHAEYAGRHHHAHTHQRAHRHPHEHHGGGREHIHAHLEAEDAGNHPGGGHHIARLAADGAHDGFEGTHDHPHEHAVPHIHRHRHGSMGVPDADHEGHDHSALEPGTDDAGITGSLGKLDFRNADLPATTYPSPDQLAAHNANELADRHPEFFTGGKIKGVTHVSVPDGGFHEAHPGRNDDHQPAAGGVIHPDVAGILDRNASLFGPPGPQAELRQQRSRQLHGPLGGPRGSGPAF